MTVARHINGITTNPLEYLLHPVSGELMVFEDKDDAVEYLKSECLEDEEINSFIFED